MRVLWSLEQWAQAVAELPVIGRLPTRTALVPNLRVAHALRVELLSAARPEVLIGTRFITPLQLASSVLLEAAEPDRPNDRELGPALAHEAFVDADLQRFQLSDVQELPGWDLSFTRTIADLDAALLAPDHCLASSDPHVSDVGRVHKVLRDRAQLRTPGAIMARAAVHAPSYSDQSPTLAVLTGFESPAELSLLRALSHVTLATWAVRPRRERPMPSASRRSWASQPTARVFTAPPAAPPWNTSRRDYSMTARRHRPRSTAASRSRSTPACTKRSKPQRAG